MRPPGGETPREVRVRLLNWLNSLTDRYSRIGVVTHRGVIRAALSQATDWDMKSDHSVAVTHNRTYEFRWKNRQLTYLAEHDLLNTSGV
jgi:probable phosphoglycerate mutase